MVEWTHAKIGSEDSGKNIVGTIHQTSITNITGYLVMKNYTLREANHNHPAGFPPSETDLLSAKSYIEKFPNIKLNVYNPQAKADTLTQYAEKALEESDTFNGLDKIIGDNKSNPEDIILDNETTGEIFEYLNKELTSFESRIFELKKSGFTYREIADILDIEPKKVDNAIQRIKSKIKSYQES